MSHSVLLFLLSSVLLVVLFVTSTNGTIIDELKKEISKEREIQNLLTASVANATKTLNEISANYNFEITTYELLKNVTSEAEKELVKELSDIFHNLTTLVDEENGLNLTLQRIRLFRKKLEYGLKWVEEDLTVLKARRDAGDDIACYKFEKTVSEGRSAPNITEDHILVLLNELRQLKTQNTDLRYFEEHVNKEIEVNRKLWENRLQQLTLLITTNAKNIKKAEEDIKKLKKDIQIVKVTIENLKREISNEDELIRKYILEVREKRVEYLPLAQADECYKKIEREILNPLFTNNFSK